MAYEIRFDVFGVRCIYAGQCTYADVQNALVTIGANIYASKLTYVLHDFTQVEKFDNGVAAVITVGQRGLSKAIDLTFQTAILATDSQFLSLLETFASQIKHDIAILKSPGEAGDWILKCFA